MIKQMSGLSCEIEHEMGSPSVELWFWMQEPHCARQTAPQRQAGDRLSICMLCLVSLVFIKSYCLLAIYYIIFKKVITT